MMQKDHFNKFTKLWKGKGYYILLGLCVVAVGVSGYFFLNGAQEEEKALSVPVTVVEPEKKPETRPAPAPAPAQTTKPVSAETEPVVPEVVTVLPVSGQVTKAYAADQLTYHATTKDWRVHNGVDLAAEVGATVQAARAGTVTAVYSDDALGTTVVILHDDGYTTHTCNLDEALPVAVGDKVQAGDPLGTVGQTALQETAEPSHLHFEVYRNSQLVDPMEFLTAQ